MSGYKLVPAEPTEEMLVAGQEEWAHRPHGALEDCEEARFIYKAMLAAAPDVQGEPLAWSGWGCQYPGKMPRLYGERRIAELNCDWENWDQLLHFTAAPQPVEQQPAPDVTALVEVLEHLVSEIESNTCPHDNTYRGGAIWEICEDCGGKWADDMGGKPEFAWPESVETARNLIHAYRKQGGEA